MKNDEEKHRNGLLQCQRNMQHQAPNTKVKTYTCIEITHVCTCMYTHVYMYMNVYNKCLNPRVLISSVLWSMSIMHHENDAICDTIHARLYSFDNNYFAMENKANSACFFLCYCKKELIRFFHGLYSYRP